MLRGPHSNVNKSFSVRMKSTLTKRGVHVKTSGYRVGGASVTVGRGLPKWPFSSFAYTCITSFDPCRYSNTRIPIYKFSQFQYDVSFVYSVCNSFYAYQPLPFSLKVSSASFIFLPYHLIICGTIL